MASQKDLLAPQVEEGAKERGVASRRQKTQGNRFPSEPQKGMQVCLPLILAQ